MIFSRKKNLPNSNLVWRRLPAGAALLWLVCFAACSTEPDAEPFVFKGDPKPISVEDLYFDNEIVIADEATRFQPTNVGFFDIDQNGFPDLLLGRDQVGKEKPEQVRILRNRSWVSPIDKRFEFELKGFLSRHNSTAFVPDG